MRLLLALVILICPLGAIADSAGAVQHLSARGGQLSLTFYHGNLNDTGLVITGSEREDFQHDTSTLEVLGDNSIGFQADEGYFTGLESGHLSLGAGLVISANGIQMDSSNLRLVPKAFTRDTLLLSDPQDTEWFYLDYGHYERLDQWLYARYLDMRISPALAQRLGDPMLAGHIVGYATLETKIDVQADDPQGFLPSCPVESPNWPTQDGFEADIAMLKLPNVSQIARQDGRVAIAPSAYFENIGNADIPWFAQFADTRNADACCFDQGDGLCAPYGNDQGGMLVYALYRYADGRLEQLGQSQVKHAFNSVNMDTSDGSLQCRAPDRGARIIPSGCEDLYQAGTNASQSFLGPREEVIAHTAQWLRAGSIWDRTGPAGVPDGNCDYMPENPVYGGQVPCLAPAADAMDRRLSVPETALNTPDARYFIEAWYLARDDVNLYNSFGRKEVTPVFTSVWTFPEVAPFQQGPVIEDFPSLQITGATSLVDKVESDEGQLQVASSATRIDSNYWRYDTSLMNLTFDRAIDGFDIPVPVGVSLTSIGFYDGDSNPDNDWIITTTPGQISFRAPEGVSLKWGSLASFRFVADRAPVETSATLYVAGEGVPTSLAANTLSAVEILFRDGFESPEEGG